MKEYYTVLAYTICLASIFLGASMVAFGLTYKYSREFRNREWVRNIFDLSLKMMSLNLSRKNNTEEDCVSIWAFAGVFLFAFSLAAIFLI